MRRRGAPAASGLYSLSMSRIEACRIERLRPGDAARYAELMSLFGRVFEMSDTYTGARPGEAWVAERLASKDFIALVALDGEAVVGGLAAYVLRKFERERSEIYIYDLAVDAGHRRRGIATALIRETVAIAPSVGAYVVFVQADRGDAPAEALYDGLGTREEVAHFDIAVPGVPPDPERWKR